MTKNYNISFLPLSVVVLWNSTYTHFCLNYLYIIRYWKKKKNNDYLSRPLALKDRNFTFKLRQPYEILSQIRLIFHGFEFNQYEVKSRRYKSNFTVHIQRGPLILWFLLHPPSGTIEKKNPLLWSQIIIYIIQKGNIHRGLSEKAPWECVCLSIL